MQSLISICAWCNKVKTPIGWVKPAKAIQILKIRDEVTPTEITHGICPACAVKWIKVDQKTFEDACQREAYATA